MEVSVSLVGKVRRVDMKFEKRPENLSLRLEDPFGNDHVFFLPIGAVNQKHSIPSKFISQENGLFFFHFLPRASGQHKLHIFYKSEGKKHSEEHMLQF